MDAIPIEKPGGDAVKEAAMKQREMSQVWVVLLESLNEVQWRKPKESKHSAGTEGRDEIKGKLSLLSVYMNGDDLSQKTREEIAAGEKSGDIVNSHICVRLARHFYLSGALEGQDTKVICDTLAGIHAFTGNQYYFAVNKERLLQLWESGQNWAGKFEYIPGKYDVCLAESAVYLRNLGFDIAVEEGTTVCSEETRKEIFCLLEKKIATIGGTNLLEKIMPEYLRYIPSIDRYLCGRTLDEERNEPFNLLFQLAAKYVKPRKVPMTEEQQQYIEEIIRLAEAFLDILDIQGSSSLEYAMFSLESFPLYLSNEMIVDKICAARQYSAQFVLLSLDYLIKPWFHYGGRPYSYDDYYRLAEWVLKNGVQLGRVDIEVIRKVTGIARYRIRQILKDISIPSGDVNRDFTDLEGNTNLFSRPVIAFPFEQFVFLDPHFCGIGFLHAASEIIRCNYPRLEREQGEAVEQMLRNEMQKKGYSIQYGKYKGQNALREGECDLVLDHKRLVFIEIKKKDIGDEMDALDDVTVLENMAFGMVRAQKQLFGHEHYLKVNGKMELGNGSVISYDPAKMPALKISVCYPEYTFLTSGSFSSKLIEILLVADFMAVDSGRQSQLDKLNAMAKEIRKCTGSDADSNVRPRDIAFFSMFCSMQQMLTAVWLSQNEDEFYEILKHWLYVRDKTLDPYVSLSYAKYLLEHPDKGSVRKAMINFLDKREHPAVLIG